MAYFEEKNSFFDLKELFFCQFPQTCFRTAENLGLPNVAHFDEINTFLT